MRHADAGRAAGVGRRREGDAVLGVAGAGTTAGGDGLEVAERAAYGHQVSGREVACGFRQGDGDGLGAGEGLRGRTTGAGDGHGRWGGVGVEGQAHAVVGLLGGAGHARQVGVKVAVSRRVAELVAGHRDPGRTYGVGRGGEGGAVLGVAGAGTAAGGYGHEVAQGATHHIHIAGDKVGARLREGEGDGLAAGDHAAALARQGNGGRAGVGHQGVKAQADLVVGLQRRARRRRAHIGVRIGVARQIGELARGHPDAGRATAVGGGREDRLVLRVAGAGAARAGHWRKAAQAAALHVNVGQGEAGAGLREREVDRLAGADHPSACAADDDGGCAGVGQRGVEGDVDQIVGLHRGAGHTGDVGVQVGIARRVGELARLHGNTGQPRAVGRWREGGGVVAVAAAGAAAGEHGRKVAQCAADHVNVGQGEGGAGLREHEGDLLAAPGGQTAAALAADGDERRRGVLRYRVVEQADLVVSLHHMAGHTVGAGAEGVQVLVARVVGESARRHAHGAHTAGVGRWREGGRVLGVARARRAAGGHGGEVAQCAAGHADVSGAEVQRGFGELEDYRLVGPGPQRSARVGAADHDRGRRGVGRDGVVRQAHLVVGLEHRTGRRRADVGVRVEVARRVREGARFDPDGGRAGRIGRGREGGAVDAGAQLRPARQRAARHIHIAWAEGAARLRQREGDHSRLACAQCALVDGDRNGRRRGVRRGRAGGGVVAQADLVVGLQRRARRRRAHIGVCVGVARQIGELARGHPDAGRAAGVGRRREGGRVLPVARARGARSHRHQVGDAAAGHIDVREREGAAGLREREVNGLAARAHRARAGAADLDGRRARVWLRGVVADRHLVVGLVACANHIGVGVGITLGIGELARRHPDGGVAAGVGTGCEGGRVLVVAAAGAAAGGHRREVAERAAHHVNVGQREGAGVLAEREGDGLCSARGQVGAARTRHHDRGRRGVGRRVGAGLGVVGNAHLVVGLVAAAADVGVGVGIARVVRELARHHANGGRTAGVGTGREGGRVVRVARARRATGGHRGEVREHAAHHINVAQPKAGARLAEREGERLAAGERAAAHARHHNRGRRGVAAGRGVGAVHAVVLHRTGAGAARATDKALHRRVRIGQQVGRGHAHAKAAVGCGRAAVALAVDHQRDRVARRKPAPHLARQCGARSTLLGGSNEVVRRHRIHAQSRLRGHTAALEHIVLRRRGRVPARARHARLHLGVLVSGQIGRRHAHAETAVRSGCARKALAVDKHRHPITGGKGATDLARKRHVARVLASGHHVVARHGAERDRGFVARVGQHIGVGVGAVAVLVTGAVARGVGGLSPDLASRHRVARLETPVAAGVCGGLAYQVAVGVIDLDRRARLGAAADGVCTGRLAGAGDVHPRAGVDGKGRDGRLGAHAVLRHIEHRGVGAIGQVGGLGKAPAAIGVDRDRVGLPVEGHGSCAARRHLAIERRRLVAGDTVAVLGVGNAVTVVVALRRQGPSRRRVGAVHAVVLHRTGAGAARATDKALHRRVRIGQQVGRGHAHAKAAVGCGRAAVALAVDHQRDRVARRKPAPHLARQCGARSTLLGGSNEVVRRHRIHAQSRLRGHTAALEHIVLRRRGRVPARARHARLHLGVLVSGQIGRRHAHAETAVRSGCARKALAVDKHRHPITGGKGATDLARKRHVARVLASGHHVVARHGAERDRGFVARMGQHIGVGVGGRGGIDAVVLLGACGGAAAAADHPFELSVGIGQQVGRGHAHAVAAIGCGRAREGLAVDRQRNRVARSVFARDLARDRQAARVLGSAQDVVSSQRIDRQRRLRGGVGALECVVLRRRGLVAPGGRDARLDLGVWVSLEVGHGHRHAVAAIGSHQGGVGLAVEAHAEQITRGVFARDFACHGVAGGTLLAGQQHVVPRNRVHRQCSFLAGIGAVAVRVTGAVARRIGGLSAHLTGGHGAAGGDAPAALGIGRGCTYKSAVGVIDLDRGAGLSAAADGIAGAALARAGDVHGWSGGVDGEALALHAVHEGRVGAIGQRPGHAVAVVAVGVRGGLTLVDRLATGVLDHHVDRGTRCTLAVDHQGTVLFRDVVAAGAAAVAARGQIAIGRTRRIIAVDIEGSRCTRPHQTQSTQQRKRRRSHHRAHGRDLRTPQRHIDRLPPFSQLPNEPLHPRVLGDVFVETTVLRLPHKPVVARRHLLVITLDDQVRAAAVFKSDLQILALAPHLHIIGRHARLTPHLLELVFGPGLRLDAHRLTLVARELLNVQGFVAFLFAGVDEDFVLLGHGDLTWL